MITFPFFIIPENFSHSGKFRHPRGTIGKIRQQQRSGRSIYLDGGIFRKLRVFVLRHAWLF
jgi:hypothetical protein